MSNTQVTGAPVLIGSSRAWSARRPLPMRAPRTLTRNKWPALRATAGTGQEEAYPTMKNVHQQSNRRNNSVEQLAQPLTIIATPIAVASGRFAVRRESDARLLVRS